MEILTEAYESAEKIGEEIRKWYRRDYPGMPVRNGTAGTEARPGQHEGRDEKGSFPEQETLNRKVRHQGRMPFNTGIIKGCAVPCVW